MPPKRQSSQPGGRPSAKKNKTATPGSAPDADGPVEPEAPEPMTDMQAKFHKAAKSFEERASTRVSTAFSRVTDTWLLNRVQPASLSPTERALWTDKHEQQLRNDWDTDPLHALIKAETDNQLNQHRAVWKVCCQFFGCTPCDIVGDAIIGSTFRLSIDQAGQKKIPVQHIACVPYSPFWPSTACSAFADILWHPLWKHGHMASLAFAVQFAVIARTDDRRSWEFDNPTDSLFVDDLRRAIDAERGLPIWKRSSVGELCRKVSESKPARQASDWAQLFSAVYTLYEDKGLQPTPTGSTYVVTTEDFVAIKKATLGMEAYDVPNLHDVVTDCQDQFIKDTLSVLE